MSNPKADVNAIVNHICILSTTGLNKKEFRDTVEEIVTAALTNSVNAAKLATDKIEQLISDKEACCPECKSQAKPARAQLAALTEQQAETRPEPCGYKFVGFPVECIKPKGHEGDHYGKFADAPTETRMPCGHLHADWVDGTSDYEYIDGIAIAKVAAELPYCCSCKQQAEAVAQAYLRIKEFAENCDSSVGLGEIIFMCQQWADESVKEAGR